MFGILRNGLPANTARNLSLISTTIVLTSILVLTAFNSYAESAGHGAHWGYSGDTGPEHWGQLAPEFGECKTGTSQSPIDIPQGAAADLAPI